MNNTRVSRLLYADIIRTTATMMVILLHSSARYFYLGTSSAQWHFANIINSFTRPAVPLFLMLSGALLLSPQRNEAPLEFLKRQFRKILPSLFIWSVFYYCLQKIVLKTEIDILEFSIGFLRGDIYYHLPFMYYIIGLYLTYPVLRSFFRGADDINVIYFAVVWLVTLLASNLSNYFNVPLSGNLLIMFGFIGYPVVGYAISSRETRLSPWAALGLFLSMWFATAYLTWHQKMTGGYSEFFYEYLSLNVVFAAFGLFYFLRYVVWEKYFFGGMDRFISIVSINSFDVFLVHPFILYVLQAYMIPSKLLQNAFSGIPLLFTLTFALSVIFAVVLARLKKIGIIKILL
jgi:surface polysaccharide O-acyltransferase-like enzyme